MRCHRFRRAGFTLVEVILAIVIALGILLVLLFFYEQATNLRSQVLEQTERLSAIRLLMERITSELRLAQSQSLVGTSNSIQFVKADVPSFAGWSGGALGRAPMPATDLKLVQYRLESLDGSNVSGMLRTEAPLIQTRVATLLDEVVATDSTSTNSLGQTNSLPLIEEIKFLQFRYWGGTNWLDSWNSNVAPQGVEVTLGPEPITNAVDLVDAEADLFRRVIYLPGVVGTTLPFLSTVSTNSPATNGLSEEAEP